MRYQRINGFLKPPLHLWMLYALVGLLILVVGGAFLVLFAFSDDSGVYAQFRAVARVVQDSRYPWTTPRIAWETATPESQGMDASKLDSLRADLAARRTEAFLVVKHGRVVYEWYSRPWGQNERNGTASLAKPLVGGMSLLVALSDERIHPDDLASQYIPAWAGHPQKSQITIRHLATHTSGISHANRDEPDGWMGAYWRRTPDPISLAIAQAPVIRTPGTSYLFSAPGMTALAYAITNSLKDTPQADIQTLLEERIMAPLGVPESEWEISYGEMYDVDGLRVYDIRGGGRFTARAVASIGELMLRKGDWKGQKLVDAAWIDEMVATGSNVDFTLPAGSPRPGLGGWQTNIDGVWPSLPRDSYIGSGTGHQILLVVPSMELVMVRMGGSLNDMNSGSDSAVFQETLDFFLFGPLMETTTSSP